MSVYRVVIEVDNNYLLYVGNSEFGGLIGFDKKIVNKADYYSFKRFLLFGLAKIPRIVYHNPLLSTHPRRPRGSQSGREKRREESFQVRAKEPLGTSSYLTIFKNSSRCRLLTGHKKCFVLLCPISEHFLLSSFPEFVHDGCCLATLARFVHQACACKGNFHFYFPN